MKLLEDGNLVSGSEESIIIIWDLTLYTPTKESIFKDKNDGIISLTKLRNGNIASGSEKGMIEIWRL